MKKLFLLLFSIPTILTAQFSFESFHCYKVVTDSSEQYCYDYIPDNFVDVQDLMFIILWYGNNEMGVMGFLEFVADWNTGGCDLNPNTITQYDYFEENSEGAIFYYSDGIGQMYWTDSDEFDNLTTCELVCVNSFIYLWNGNTYYFHR